MKTKIATSIEQSKKLLELGLNADTADMCYTNYKFQTDDTGNLIDGSCKPIGGLTIGNPLGDFPAWSLSALLKLMPQFTLNGFCNGKFNCRDERVDSYVLVDSNPLDAAYSMVVQLIEQGYIKTEKK